MSSDDMMVVDKPISPTTGENGSSITSNTAGNSTTATTSTKRRPVLSSTPFPLATPSLPTTTSPTNHTDLSSFSLHTTLTHLIDFLLLNLPPHYPASTLTSLRTSIITHLTPKLSPTWDPTNPSAGCGLRSLIAIPGKFPTPLVKAALEAGVDPVKWTRAISQGGEWEVWVDPGSVCFREGGWLFVDEGFENKTYKQTLHTIWQAPLAASDPTSLPPTNLYPHSQPHKPTSTSIPTPPTHLTRQQSSTARAPAVFRIPQLPIPLALSQVQNQNQNQNQNYNQSQSQAGSPFGASSEPGRGGLGGDIWGEPTATLKSTRSLDAAGLGASSGNKNSVGFEKGIGFGRGSGNVDGFGAGSGLAGGLFMGGAPLVKRSSPNTGSINSASVGAVSSAATGLQECSANIPHSSNSNNGNGNTDPSRTAWIKAQAPGNTKSSSSSTITTKAKRIVPLSVAVPIGDGIGAGAFLSSSAPGSASLTTGGGPGGFVSFGFGGDAFGHVNSRSVVGMGVGAGMGRKSVEDWVGVGVGSRGASATEMLRKTESQEKLALKQIQASGNTILPEAGKANALLTGSGSDTGIGNGITRADSPKDPRVTDLLAVLNGRASPPISIRSGSPSASSVRFAPTVGVADMKEEVEGEQGKVGEIEVALPMVEQKIGKISRPVTPSGNKAGAGKKKPTKIEVQAPPPLAATKSMGTSTSAVKEVVTPSTSTETGTETESASFVSSESSEFQTRILPTIPAKLQDYDGGNVGVLGGGVRLGSANSNSNGIGLGMPPSSPVFATGRRTTSGQSRSTSVNSALGGGKRNVSNASSSMMTTDSVDSVEYELDGGGVGGMHSPGSDEQGMYKKRGKRGGRRHGSGSSGKMSGIIPGMGIAGQPGATPAGAVPLSAFGQTPAYPGVGGGKAHPARYVPAGSLPTSPVPGAALPAAYITHAGPLGQPVFVMPLTPTWPTYINAMPGTTSVTGHAYGFNPAVLAAPPPTIGVGIPGQPGGAFQVASPISQIMTGRGGARTLRGSKSPPRGQQMKRSRWIGQEMPGESAWDLGKAAGLHGFGAQPSQ